MIGQAPDRDSFRRMFPWPDAVINIQPDGSDVLDVIARLERVPEQVLTISQMNAAEALLRHDWVYRWKELLQLAGLDPAPAMAARERRLRELADLICPTATQPLERDVEQPRA